MIGDKNMNDFQLAASKCGVPDHDIEPLELYVKHGIQPGGFLTAVLENNLMESLGRADEENRYCLFQICQFIYNDIPASCHGSPEKVRQWIERFTKTEEQE